MNRKTLGDITKTRFINGQRYRFDATPRELDQLEKARLDTVTKEIDPAILASMLEGVETNRVEAATRVIKEAYRRSEVSRIKAAVAQVERLEEGIAYIRSHGQIIADGGPIWHTTFRG